MENTSVRYRSSTLSVGQQVAQMRLHFPTFRYHLELQQKRHIPTWRGTLQPTEISPIYHTQIQYRCPKMPQVWILSPMLPSDAPHRYSNGALCLYYPGDGSWTPAHSIAQTIVPWTALWLTFYEIWQRTGTWYGAEVSHNQAKKQEVVEV
jgi:hypothetical protein